MSSQRRTDVSNAQVMDRPQQPLEADIGSWIQPISLDEFMEAYWQTRPLYIAGGASRLDVLRRLLAGFNLRALLQTAGPPHENSVRAWFLNGTATDFRLNVQPAQAEILFDAGFTLYFEP